MSLVVEIETLAHLDQLVEDWDHVVVDFSAPGWCIPCKRLAPHFERAAELFPNVVFAKVDVDTVEGASGAYGIMSVPTVHYFRSGFQREEIKGRTVNALKKEIEELLQ